MNRLRRYELYVIVFFFSFQTQLLIRQNAFVNFKGFTFTCKLCFFFDLASIACLRDDRNGKDYLLFNIHL